MATVRPENGGLRDSLKKKKVAVHSAKWLVAFTIAVGTFAITGWWLYLKLEIMPLAGGVPAGMVAAFDLPEDAHPVGNPRKIWVARPSSASAKAMGLMATSLATADTARKAVRRSTHSALTKFRHTHTVARQ